MHPQLILLGYWLVMIVLSAFFLRLACGLCQTGLPSWKRAIISTLVVSFLAYLTFDFTCYIILRSLQDVSLYLPQWYGYNIWFREPIGLKWAIVSKAGPFRYIPLVFAVCAAGVLQVVVLQAEVTYRFGLLIVFLQWIATIVAGYIVGLLLGVVLGAVGGSLQPPAPAPEQVQRKLVPRSRQPAGSRDKSRDKQQDDAESISLQAIQHQLEDKAHSTSEYLQSAGAGLKDYAETHLDGLKEDAAPVVERLPQPVQNFLDKGGWWWILGGLAVLSLLWLRSIMRRLLTAASRPKKKKKNRPMKKVTVNLKEDLQELGEALTEEGPQRLTVKKMPARLRLVILSAQSRNTGELSEEMADRVLDWMQTGLSEVTAEDYPRVRVWPIFPSLDAFDIAFAKNVPIPGPKDGKSRWVLVSGQVHMGKSIVNVGLGLYADEANKLRNQTVKGDKWRGLLGVKQGQLVGAD